MPKEKLTTRVFFSPKQTTWWDFQRWIFFFFSKQPCVSRWVLQHPFSPVGSARSKVTVLKGLLPGEVALFGGWNQSIREVSHRDDIYIYIICIYIYTYIYIYIFFFSRCQQDPEFRNLTWNHFKRLFFGWQNGQPIIYNRSFWMQLEW